MNIGDKKTPNAHDDDRERRLEQEARQQKAEASLNHLEKRSWEKVQEILKDQDQPEHQSDTQVLPKESPSPAVSARSQAKWLKVGDIMTGKVATIKFDDTVMTVKGIFSRVKFHHLPVVDDNGYLIGIISDRDFLASVSPFVGTVNEQTRDIELLKRKVGLIMTRNPSSVSINADLTAAIRQMNEYKVSCLPVVNPATRQLLGIITWKDIVKAFCPEAFTARDSAKLKTGVNLRPKTTDSGRFISTDSGRFLYPDEFDEKT